MQPSLEARVIRKLNGRILPFVMLLYFVSFLDRVNVGFAALSMNQALGLTPAMFGFGGGIFFLGYVLLEVPSNLILHRVGARLWIARVMISWGLVSAASAFAVGPKSFYLLRFLLGVTEAGFFPGIIFYLSLWFPARQRAAAAAAFMAAVPLSTAIGSPLSGALMELPTFAGIANWQWLYILEGLPAVILGFLVLRILTDRPAVATWLASDERDWLMRRLASEQAGNAGAPGHTADVWRAMRDPRVLVLSLIYFGTSAGLYAIGLWAPMMIRQFGFSALQVGLVNGLPGLAAIAAMILWARHSDRTAERTWHVVLPCVAASLGLIWAGYARSGLAVVLALSAVNIGVNAAKPPIWAIPSVFLSGAAAAAGIALINSIGNVGGFVAPVMIGWLKSRTGSYAGGLCFVAATLALSAVAMLVLSSQAGPRKDT